MEDRVIVDKKKYDELLDKNSVLEQEKAKNTIYVTLYNQTYNNIRTDSFVYGENIPENIKKTFDIYKDHLEHLKKYINEDSKRYEKAIEIAKELIGEKKKAEKDLENKIKGLPRILKWWFNLKDDDKRIN